MKPFVAGCLVLVLSLSIAAAADPAGKPFLGAIPVQYVAPNEEVTLDMHRFFYATGKEKLEIGKKDGVTASFDPATFQLKARAAKGGLYDVEIKAGDLKTVLTLAAGSAESTYHFAFTPGGTASKVFLAGAFNGWNTSALAMNGPDASGQFTADVPLKPGRYGYKFVVDGKWTIDPANSQTEDNGMGDKNSLAVVESGGGGGQPVLYADKLTPETLSVNRATKDSADTVSAVFEGATGATLVSAKKNNGVIEVSLPKDQEGFVRVVGMSSSGKPSNTVRCAVGGKGKFRWQDGVLYYAFTDRFADGDKANDKPVDNANVLPPANYHGGDLRGITQKIEEGYFEKLGANTIWVAPLNRNPAGAYQEYPEPHRWYTGYHGYWPVSSTELDPHIGADKDLHQLVDAAHKRGMKVIADLVLHHVHAEHPWWKQHRDWFGQLDLPDGRKNLRLWDEQQFTTWFEPYLPSFDFSKDAPVKALIDNSVWWANTYKLDGFRLDAVKHILPSFWWKFRAALREQVDAKRDTPLYLVGETFKDRAGIMTFVGPNMLDGQFDFPLYDQMKDTFGLTTGGMKTLDDALAASEKAYGKETLMSALVGNHDKGRFMAYADHDLPVANTKEEEVGWKNPPKVDDPGSYQKLELAQAFLFAIDGVPMIYYGDEIGMTGAGDPDNRRDMRFGDQVAPEEKGVFENFQKLGALRKAHPALRYGSRRTLVADQDLYAFVRAHLDDRVVAVFNRGKSEAKAELLVNPEMADGDYTEALSGKTVIVKDGKLEVSLPAQTAAFVTKK